MGFVGLLQRSQGVSEIDVMLHSIIHIIKIKRATNDVLDEVAALIHVEARDKKPQGLRDI